MTHPFRIKWFAVILVLWFVALPGVTEAGAAIVITREDASVDVFSLPSSYESPIEITTYFDTLHLVAGGAIAAKYSLDFQLPGSPLAFQNSQRGMILSYISTTIDCRYEKQYSEGDVDRSYIRIHFILAKPDVPTFLLPSHPLCPGSQYRLQAEAERSERFEFQASQQGLLAGSLLMIPQAWSSPDPILVRSRAVNFHGFSEWSAWRTIAVSQRVGGLRMEGPRYATAGTLHTFSVVDDGSGRGEQIIEKPKTSYLWQLNQGLPNVGTGAATIEIAIPAGYGVLECTVSNPDYCIDTTLRRQLVSANGSLHGMPEIAVAERYVRTDSPFPLYLRSSPGRQPDLWYLDNVAIPAQDGLFMVNPALLPEGKHHLRTFLYESLSIEAWITIE
ncbi:MAG: hypothetical protein AB7C90_06170 [Bacteroidales bacterium]